MPAHAHIEPHLSGKIRVPDSAPVDSVVITTVDRKMQIVAKHGDGMALPSGGMAGYEVVARPGRTPLTIWRGASDGLTVPVSLVLDGWGDGDDGTDDSVVGDFQTLNKMAGLLANEEPPQLIVKGIPYPSERWVIQTLEWTGGIRRHTDGHYVRLTATVTLLRFTQDSQLHKVKAHKPQAKYRHIKARKNDTFEDIARRELGSKRLGTRLARLNGRRSPDVKLTAGHAVRLPAGQLLADWRKSIGK